MPVLSYGYSPLTNPLPIAELIQDVSDASEITVSLSFWLTAVPKMTHHRYPYLSQDLMNIRLSF